MDMEHIDWLREPGVTDWVVEPLRASNEAGELLVASIVPDCFSRYVRLLHPFWQGAEKVRWTDLVPARGARLRPETRHEDLESTEKGIASPVPGTLDQADLDALIELLAGFTADRERCWFGYWNGYAWTPTQSVVSYKTRRGSPDRPVLMRSGSLRDTAMLMDFPGRQSPNIWWPDSRDWFVVSEVDFASTYVGGPHEFIDSILDDDRLEAIAVQPTDAITD